MNFLPLFLPKQPQPPTSYRVEMPCMTADWITSKTDRQLHHHTKAKKVAYWRKRACDLARVQQLPHMHRAYIVGEVRFTDRRERDPANWYPTMKAVVDGLVDAAVLLDDSAKYVIGPDMRLGPIDSSPNLIVHVWPLEVEV